MICLAVLASIMPTYLLSMAGLQYSLSQDDARFRIDYFSQPVQSQGVFSAKNPLLSPDQRQYLSRRRDDCSGAVHDGNKYDEMVNQFCFYTEPKNLFIKPCPKDGCAGYTFCTKGASGHSVLYPCASLCELSFWKKALIITHRTAVQLYAQFALPSQNTILSACMGALFVIFFHRRAL